MKRSRTIAYIHVMLLAMAGLAFASCTKDITGNLPDLGTSTVVDGSIENGKPPVVLLTRSTKVFGDLNINDLGAFFQHGAHMYMTVDNDSTQIPLEEICLRSLSAIPDSVKWTLLYSLGVTIYDSSSVPDVCVYTLPLTELAAYYNTGSCPHCGAENHTYHLNIKLGNKTFTAYTSIPQALGIDGLSIRNAPNNDSLVNVMATISVPASTGHFIRYWTQRNDEPFYTPYSGSVYDDKLWVGRTLTLPLERGIPGYIINPDPATYGYFWKGDTVTLKWANIDSRTYDFFNTLENDGGGSPFSSPLRVKSNISGDSVVGVWAGYAARYYTIIVPPR